MRGPSALSTFTLQESPMRLSNWLSPLFAPKAAPAPAARRRSFRPLVEGCEDRILLSGSPLLAPPPLAPAQSPAALTSVSFDAHDAFHNGVNGQNNLKLDRSLTDFITVDVYKVVNGAEVYVKT